MSLTFNRAPPLAPSSLHLELSKALAPHANAARSPPLSPLNSSPPTSATLSSQPTSPVTFPAGPPLRGTRAVPAPQLFASTHIRESQTPFNTLATPPRAAPILAPRLSISGTAAGHGTVPSSLSTPLGGVRPINTVSAMRGRGIGIGAASAGRGVGIPGSSSKGEVSHAMTPGNTPSSMERIGKRMASNLMLGNAAGESALNKIAPSYERRFNAGLNDLGNRLDEHVQSGLRSAPQTISPSMGRGNAPYLGGARSEWPSQFGDESESDEGRDAKQV